MNYMKIISYDYISSSEVISKFIFKESENINIVDKTLIVPYFMVLEGIFQTAGKVARESTGNRFGAYIVSFKKVKFKRPIFKNEVINIKATLNKINNQNKCTLFNIYVSAGEEIIIDGCSLILKQDENVDSSQLNNSKCLTINEQLLNLNMEGRMK